MLSLTGFGRSEYNKDNILLTVSISALNSRFYDCNIKIPRVLNKYEEEILLEVKKRCKRGRISININLSNNNETLSNVDLNEDKFHKYIEIIDKIKDKISVNDKINIRDILLLPDIFMHESNVKDEELKEILLNNIIFALED